MYTLNSDYPKEKIPKDAKMGDKVLWCKNCGFELWNALTTPDCPDCKERMFVGKITKEDLNELFSNSNIQQSGPSNTADP